MKKLSYFVVILLLISSIAAIGIGKEAGEVENENTLVFKSTDQVTFEMKTPRQTTGPTNIAGNVLISASEDDDIQPTITKDSSGRFVVAFATKKSILEQTITLSYSEDGSIFNDASEFSSEEGGILQYPAITSIPEAGDVGISFTDPLSEYPITMWRIGDITDSESYNGISYSWGDTEDYEEVTVTYVHELFVVMWTVHNYYLSDIPRCPYICYMLPDLEFPTEIGAQYFDGQSILNTAPATNIDIETGQDYFYLLFEHDNETTGHSEIAFKKSVTDLELLYTSGGGPGGMDKYADIEAMPWQMYLVKGDFDAKDPSVGASGNNVVVVYMINDAGDWDIKCSYSSDDGDTWETSVVADDHPTDELYPAVYMSGNTVFCTYIKDGNLYVIKSEDTGATWGEPLQVNEESGTVIAEPNAVEISEAGIVWTDNRNGNKDIYYAPGTGDAPFKPNKPDGPTSGRTGQAQTYKTSTIDPNGDDVSYGWDWNDDDVVDEWSDFVGSGEEASISHTFESDYTGNIKVKAKNTNDDESPWSDPLSISMPRNKSYTDRPFLRFLQNFLQQYPILYQLLQRVLRL